MCGENRKRGDVWLKGKESPYPHGEGKKIRLGYCFGPLTLPRNHRFSWPHAFAYLWLLGVRVLLAMSSHSALAVDSFIGPIER